MPFAGGKREIHATRASMGMFDGIKNSWNEATEIKTKEKQVQCQCTHTKTRPARPLSLLLRPLFRNRANVRIPTKCSQREMEREGGWVQLTFLAQDEAFKYQVGYLVKKDKIDLNDLLEMMKEGAEQQGYKGWRKHMPGTSSNPQVQELEKNEKIIMAIPPELRAELGRFKGMEVSSLFPLPPLPSHPYSILPLRPSHVSHSPHHTSTLTERAVSMHAQPSSRYGWMAAAKLTPSNGSQRRKSRRRSRLNSEP